MCEREVPFCRCVILRTQLQVLTPDHRALQPFEVLLESDFSGPIGLLSLRKSCRDDNVRSFFVHRIFLLPYTYGLSCILKWRMHKPCVNRRFVNLIIPHFSIFVKYFIVFLFLVLQLMQLYSRRILLQLYHQQPFLLLQ